jgi:hypothetical protein
MELEEGKKKKKEEAEVHVFSGLTQGRSRGGEEG